MEKSFLSLKNRKAREAYLEAELINGLAHQIRIIRQQRGWTQKEFAIKLGTTQATVSRLEDPAYGKYTLKTLLAISKTFDVALFMRYMAFSKFMPATWDTNPENFRAATYDEEVSLVQFYSESYSESKCNEYAVATIPSSDKPAYQVTNISKNALAESFRTIATLNNMKGKTRINLDYWREK